MIFYPEGAGFRRAEQVNFYRCARVELRVGQISLDSSLTAVKCLMCEPANTTCLDSRFILYFSSVFSVRECLFRGGAK